MERNIISEAEHPRILQDAELDLAVGGIAASQVWVSPMAIHGFNPQPDAPAIWNVRTFG
jgi:hypothetical protein